MVMVIVISAAAYFLIVYGNFKQWKFSRLLNDMQSGEDNALQQQMRAINEDVSGGFTPEETITLYREAIERRDYAAASSYFIGDKQAQEFRNFLSAEEYALEEYLQLIKKPYQGAYSDDGSLYTARYELAGPDFFARFRKYPNQRWKIIEI